MTRIVFACLLLAISTPMAASADDATRDCSKFPEMVKVPPGSLLMGGDHRVTLNAFALGRTEVTQKQWNEVMDNNPSYFSKCGDQCPVEQVSWDDVQEFIFKRNKITGLKYRLPSEAEWEYACRANSDTTYCGGESALALGWFASNSNRKTHPVTSKVAPNAWGLHDMNGNVWEWTQDCANASHKNVPKDGRAAKSGDCSRREVRGGAWNSIPGEVRADGRFASAADTRHEHQGFRLACDLP